MTEELYKKACDLKSELTRLDLMLNRPDSEWVLKYYQLPTELVPGIRKSLEERKAKLQKEFENL